MAKEFICTKTEPVVQTKAGKVRGFILDGTYTFHGIRYATAKRFQMPQEVEPWEGVKDALSYGYVCPMLNDPIPNGEVMVPHRYWPTSEDCLFLNVWTRSVDPAAKKPVMVWLHGGGFSDGSSIEQAAYDGENLCKFGDVVVVTINHRLNVLGYLDVSSISPDYYNSANAGTEDMVAALRWVRDNIAAFGGDPDNVTLFGQSGGGAKIWTLMQTPSAYGLFHKGVVQSGVFDMIAVKKSDGRAITRALLEELGIPEAEGKKLAEVPYRELAEAYKKVSPALAEQGEYVGLSPLQNDYMLGDPRLVGFSDFAKTVPVMVGTVLGEFAFGPAIPNREALSEEEKTAMIAKKYGAESTPKLIQLFREAYPEKDLTDLLFVDLLFRVPSLDFIMKRADSSDVPVYSYQLTYDFPFDGGHIAWHCSEIPYVFHNTDKAPYTNVPGVSDRLEEQMSGAWVNFARCGNPNHPSLPEWPACTPGDEVMMLFDETCRAAHKVDWDLLSLLKQVAPVFDPSKNDEPIQH